MTSNCLFTANQTLLYSSLEWRTYFNIFYLICTELWSLTFDIFCLISQLLNVILIMRGDIQIKIFIRFFIRRCVFLLNVKCVHSENILKCDTGHRTNENLKLWALRRERNSLHFPLHISLNKNTLVMPRLAGNHSVASVWVKPMITVILNQRGLMVRNYL